MSYSQLVSEITVDTRKFEAGIDLADTMGKALARTTYAATVRLDTKGLKADLGSMDATLKAALKPIILPAELSFKVTGDVLAIQKSEAVSKGLEKAEASLKQLQHTFDNFTTQSLRTELSEAAGAGAKIVTGLEAVNRESARVSKGLAEASESGARFRSTFSGALDSIKNFVVGGAIVNGLSGAFQGLKSSIIDYEATIQTSKVSLTAMFQGNQKAADDLIKSIQGFAVKTPLEFEQVLPWVPQLRAAKQDIKAIIPDLTALGDAGAVSGKDINEAVNGMVRDFISLSARGKVTAHDINNFGSYGVNAVTYLAQAYSSVLPKGTKAAEMAMRDMIHKGLIPADQAIKAIVAGIENDPLKAGQMQKMSHTYTTALSNIGDAWKAVVGGGVAAQFNGLTDKLVQLGDVMMTPAFQSQAAAGIHLTVDALTALGKGALWAGEIAADKLPYMVGALTILGSAKMYVGVRTLGTELFTSFGKASIPIAVATAAVIAFVAAYRNFPVVRDVTDVVVGGILEDFKALSYSFQKIRGEVGAITEFAGNVIGKGDWIKWGAAQQGLETGTAKYWDNLIDGWTNTGSKKMRQFLTSDYGKMLGIDGLSKSILAQMNQAAGNFPTPAIPHFGEDDTNASNNGAKGQKKALEALAKSYDQLAKSAEDSATRQLSALTKVNDSMQKLFGSIQSELSKYGVFNSPLDSFFERIQKLLDIPDSAQSIVNNATKRIRELSEAARTTREAAAKISTTVLPAGTSGDAGTGAARLLTTYKTREEMVWSDAFKHVAEGSTRVQQLVATQFKGNWDKMFAVMGDTSEDTRQRLMRLAKPVTTQTVERFAHPDEWSLKRFNDVAERFMLQARLQVGPRTSVPRIDGRNPAFESDPGLDSNYYEQLVNKRAGELANAYLRKIGELKDVTLTTGGGYPSGFDFGSVKRTQTAFHQTVTVPAGVGSTGASGGPSIGTDGSAVINNFLPSTVQAGTRAGSALIENLVRSFNDQSPRKLGASCADVAAKVLNQLGESLKYSSNARQLVKNARDAGWVPVALGTPGSLNVQSGPGFGKVSGMHVTVGVGNGRVAGSSKYAFQEFDITGAKGHPFALAPSKDVSRFLVKAGKATGMGDAAALGGGSTSVVSLQEKMSELLKNLTVTKFSLPKEWGAPIAEAANNANRFAAQMLLADEHTQNLFKAKLGDKFGEFVKALRATTNAADGYIERLKAAKTITDELRALDAKNRARGRENDPFFALDERRRPGGDLSSLLDLSAVQKKAMAVQATVLEAVVKVNTLSKFAQGPTLPAAKLEEMATHAEDLRRTMSAATNFEMLQAKTLRDALDTQTFALTQNAKAVQDRKKVLEAGSKFVTANSFNELGYARAIELAGKTTEYWAGEGVKALKRQEEALEAVVKGSALAKFAQGPVALPSVVKVAKAQAEQIHSTLATNLDKTLSAAGSVFDFEKAFGRKIDVAKLRQGLDRQLSQISEAYRIASEGGSSLGQMDKDLEKSGFYFEHIFGLIDAGHGERAKAIATELANSEQVAANMNRALESAKEWGKDVDERTRSAALNTTLRGLYTTLPGGSGQLNRRVFEEQTKSDLMARFDKGEFDVPTNTITAALRSMRGITTAPQFSHDIGEVTKRLTLALQGYDDKSTTERIAQGGERLAQMRLDLSEKQAAIDKPLSEFAKAQASFIKLQNDLKAQGLTLSADDLKVQQQQLEVAKGLDAAALQLWRKQQDQQLQLSGIFDPNKRADLQFRLDHQDWDKTTVDAALAFDQFARKQEEFNQRSQGLLDDWKSSWIGMFDDIATKGKFSLNSFLDSIGTRLAQWGADTLANEGWKLLQNLLTSFAVGTLGGGQSAPTIPSVGAVGDAAGTFIPSPTIPSIGATGVATSALQQSHMLAMSAARQTAANGGGYGMTVNNFYGENHWSATRQSELGREVAGKSNGSNNSRRTDAKYMRQAAGVQETY